MVYGKNFKSSFTKLILIMALLSDACYGIEMPPVRVDGNVNTAFGKATSSGGQVDTNTQIISANLGARSYIWRPWFALISGGLSFSDNRYKSGNNSNDSQFIGESLQLGLFPKSYFPFSIYGSRTMFRPGESITVNDTVTTSFGLQQSYSTPQGANYNFRYDHRLYDAGVSSLNETNIFEGMASKSVGYNRFGGLLNIKQLEDKINKNQAVDYVFTGRHSYVGLKNLHVESLFSSVAFNTEVDNTKSDRQTNQLSTFLSWRPNGRKRLNIAGSARLIGNLRDRKETDKSTGVVTGSSDEAKSFNISQSLSYLMSPRATFSEAVTGTFTERNNSSTSSGSETFNLNYSDKVIKTKAGDYNWGGGGSVSNVHGVGEAAQVVSSSLSHSLRNSFTFFNDIDINGSVSQSLSGSKHTLEGSRGRLKHTLTLKWSDRQSERSITPKTSMIEFRFGDDRRLDEVSVFQIYNLQASTFRKITAYSQVNGNLTVQKIVNKTGQSQSSSTTTVNGQITYSNSRFLDVYHLKYDSAIRFSKQRSKIETKIASVNPQDEPSDFSWTNKITHRIGLLRTRFNFDVTKFENKYDYSIRIQLTRSF